MISMTFNETQRAVVANKIANIPTSKSPTGWTLAYSQN
jgi:hypothetical protein